MILLRKILHRKWKAIHIWKQQLGTARSRKHSSIFRVLIFQLGQCLLIFKLDLGPDYMSQAGPVSRAGPVCRDLGKPVKRNKNQLCDYMTTGPARLAEIPVLRTGIPANRAENFPCNHVYRPSPANRDSKKCASKQTCSPVNCPFSL